MPQENPGAVCDATYDEENADLVKIWHINFFFFEKISYLVYREDNPEDVNDAPDGKGDTCGDK